MLRYRTVALLLFQKKRLEYVRTARTDGMMLCLDYRTDLLFQTFKRTHVRSIDRLVRYCTSTVIPSFIDTHFDQIVLKE